MRFYLTTLNLVKYLTEVCPILSPDEEDITTLAVVQFWKDNEYLCKNYILNGLVDDLYNVYSNIPLAKELWDSFEKKYKTEDVGIKKFVVAKFLDFHMVDDKSVVTQIEEFQIIVHDILSKGMLMCEPLQVATVIEKLPPSWVDFKNYLKHKCKTMNKEDLTVCLRIEEDNQKKSKLLRTPKAHLVETSKPKHGKRKREHQTKGKPKEQPNKFQGTCFVCDKTGHRPKIAESVLTRIRTKPRARERCKPT
ncbi:uncharacterized protein LOC120010478 [Tripterygium wilfordii]|uniref:uncharacterized protein LOC120010478 n=1 Tax=Tripterygium wilfordii TaxID=458696 RepID=UPI0018F82962|nr:uncharacterized protein LOC120010478 [Tripterygium wilfordii]